MATLAEQIAALKLPALSEDEFAKYVGLTPAQYAKYKLTMTDDDRAFCEQARAVEALCPLWQAGIEPYPSDVSVNRGSRPKARKRREAPTP